jgi:hypothetical protein
MGELPSIFRIFSWTCWRDETGVQQVMADTKTTAEFYHSPWQLTMIQQAASVLEDVGKMDLDLPAVLIEKLRAVRVALLMEAATLKEVRHAD